MGSNSARGEQYQTAKLKPPILDHVANGLQSSKDAIVTSKQGWCGEATPS
jgi:hypothetical protein